MRWFSRSKTSKSTPRDKKGRTRARDRSTSSTAQDRPRRERYSAWNDPDLPRYGDPSDG